MEEGDKCLLLLPTNYNKLLTQRKGPYEVMLISDLNHIINMIQNKRFLINMLMKYYTPKAESSTYITPSLSPEYLDCLTLVRGHLQDDTKSAATVIPHSSKMGKLHTAQLHGTEMLVNVNTNKSLLRINK